MGKKNLVSKPICFHKYIINWFNFCPCQLRPTRIHYFYTRPIRSIIFHRKKIIWHCQCQYIAKLIGIFRRQFLWLCRQQCFREKKPILCYLVKALLKGFTKLYWHFCRRIFFFEITVLTILHIDFADFMTFSIWKNILLFWSLINVLLYKRYRMVRANIYLVKQRTAFFLPEKSDFECWR